MDLKFEDVQDLGLKALTAEEVENVVMLLRILELKCRKKIAENWVSTSMMAQWGNQAKNYEQCRHLIGDKTIFEWKKGGEYQWKL